jgi:S1-C subfamily serine protease
VHGTIDTQGGTPGLGFMPVYDGGDLPGVTVDSVRPDSAADKAGIAAGDRIVEMAGAEVADVFAYTDLLSGLKVGQKIDVLLVRGEETIRLDVVVGRSNR